RIHFAAPVKQLNYLVFKKNKDEVEDSVEEYLRDDEARMRRDVERIHFAAPVKQLNYLVFKKNKDEVEDSVEEYLRD
ncbi:hypothetical protein HT105_25310, partial [Bacteroides fragilis]|nr:hypothetical protein [Bacteroides fragilis]